MNSRKLLASALVLGLGALAGCSGEQQAKPVSFQKDVFPILKASCADSDSEGELRGVSHPAQWRGLSKDGPVDGHV